MIQRWRPGHRAQDYIEKPIRDVDALRFRIRRALSRRDEQLARAQATARVDKKRLGEKGRILVVEMEGYGARSSPSSWGARSA